MAIQCLETAFGVSMEDQSLAVSQTLPEIFEAVAGKVRELPETFPYFIFFFPEFCWILQLLFPSEPCGRGNILGWKDGNCGNPHLSFSLSLEGAGELQDELRSRHPVRR